MTQYNEEKMHERMMSLADPRVSAIIVWSGGVLGVFFTSAMIWLAAGMVEVKTNIAVLLARPEGITRSEYVRDQARRDADGARRDEQIEQMSREIRQGRNK